MKNSHCTQGSLFEEFSDNSEVQQKPELANPWALDCNGNPILPEKAERHGNYTCPKCLEPLNVFHGKKLPKVDLQFPLSRSL